MATIVPTQHPLENPALTKPTYYMVSASLAFAKANESPATTYTNNDPARLVVLNTLNWYEAHDEYAWPDFTSMGFDFGQSMRLRRQLVSDVCTALEKAGKIRIVIGGLRSPESVGGEGSKRCLVSACMAERKRQCKRNLEDQSDTEVASNAFDKRFWHDEAFLAELMHVMIGHPGADVDGYLNGEKDVGALAAIVHDSLAMYFNIPHDLQKKKQAWEAVQGARVEERPELVRTQTGGSGAGQSESRNGTTRSETTG